MDDFNNVSLSRQTFSRRIAKLSADIQDEVFEKSKSFDFYSTACYERKCDEVCNGKEQNLWKTKTGKNNTEK